MSQTPWLQLKKIHPDAKIPTRASASASGYDLYSIEKVILKPGETGTYSTGWEIAVADGYEGQIRLRSGVGMRRNLIIPNAPGTIDSDYRGELKVIVRNIYMRSPICAEDLFVDDKEIIQKDEAVAQLIISPVVTPDIEIVDELSSTERNKGGFGSTDDV